VGALLRERKKKDDLDQGFTFQDQQVLVDLASHISVAMQSMNDEETKLGLKETIKILKVTNERKELARRDSVKDYL